MICDCTVGDSASHVGHADAIARMIGPLLSRLTGLLLDAGPLRDPARQRQQCFHSNNGRRRRGQIICYSMLS